MLIARKPKENHWAKKEWAPSVIYYKKNMNRIIHEKINGYSNHYSILDNRTLEKKNENKKQR